MENREIVITVSKEQTERLLGYTDMGSRVVDNGLRQNICLHNSMGFCKNPVSPQGHVVYTEDNY